MTPAHIAAALCERLRIEARDRCGYCHTQQALAYAPLEVDHIIPVAAGGDDEVDNLWLACRPCNQYKGTQVYGVDPLVVTAPFHVRRAGCTFRALLPGVTITVSLGPIPAKIRPTGGAPNRAWSQ